MFCGSTTVAADRWPDDGAVSQAVHYGRPEIGETTPLLTRFTLEATWANVCEHAAGPLDYWGSRGRGFKSRRPDKNYQVRAGFLKIRKPALDHLTVV